MKITSEHLSSMMAAGLTLPASAWTPSPKLLVTLVGGLVQLKWLSSDEDMRKRGTPCFTTSDGSAKIRPFAAALPGEDQAPIRAERPPCRSKHKRLWRLQDLSTLMDASIQQESLQEEMGEALARLREAEVALTEFIF